MRRLVLTPKFKRAFRRFVRRDARLRKKIEDTLGQMQDDVFQTSLGTHKLSGDLLGLWACVCGYDCRIVFSVEREGDNEVIILLNIGTHDEVY